MPSLELLIPSQNSFTTFYKVSALTPISKPLFITIARPKKISSKVVKDRVVHNSCSRGASICDVLEEKDNDFGSSKKGKARPKVDEGPS